MFWLDWKLFGNGHGMASPYHDDVFFWLDKRFYRWIGGLGAQLSSIEWWIPKPGTRRMLFGEDFTVCTAERKWIRVWVTWTRTRPVRDYSEVRTLVEKLKSWGHGL